MLRINISEWVTYYALRCYVMTLTVTEIIFANEHLTSAWNMLLEAAYGGKHTKHDDIDIKQITSNLNFQDQNINCVIRASSSNQMVRPHAQESHTTSVIQQRNMHNYGSHDSDSFTKDGLCRMPINFTLSVYQSPNPTGIMNAWSELLIASNNDPALCNVSAFRYSIFVS